MLAEIAVSYAVVGQSDQALQVAQRMDKSQIKVEVLSQIAYQTAKAGQAKQAAAMFTQALQEANKLELPPDKVMGLEAIATKYRLVGQNDKATEILSQAVQGANDIWGVSFVKDTVLERIAIAYAKLGDYNRGIQVANQIVEDVPKGRALAQIVAQYVAQGEYDQAREVANSIEAKASKANALIEIAPKTGEYQQALWAAQKIDENESAQLKSIVLAKIALLYSKAGQEKQAAEVVSQALQAAKRIEEPASQVSQLTKIALLYAQVGKKEQAAEVCSQALQVTRQFPDAAKKAVFLAGVAVVYGKAGRNDLATAVFTQALQLAQALENEDNKARTLAFIAIASAKINPYNQAIELTQTIGDANIEGDALTQMAKDYEKAGNKQQAAQALEQAFGIVKTSKNSQQKDQRLAEIAVQLGKIAQFDRAITVVQTIDATEKDSSKAFALARIANYYAKAGQKEKAIALLSQALQAANTTKCSD
jgi:tetratricopeptide (TPR) repeat protein